MEIDESSHGATWVRTVTYCDGCGVAVGVYEEGYEGETYETFVQNGLKRRRDGELEQLCVPCIQEEERLFYPIGTSAQHSAATGWLSRSLMRTYNRRVWT